MKKIIFGLSIALFIFSACTKKATIPDRFTPIPEGNTNVKFLNFSPGSPQINFYANGIKTTAFSATTTGVVTGMGYTGIYPSTFGYATIPAGTLTVDAKVTDSSTIMPGAKLLTSSQTFDARKFYTFALVDTFTKISFVAVEDDPTVPDQTKSYLRVANFLADSAINVVITKTSADYPYSKTYTNVAPKTVLAFDSLGAGTGQIYKIEIKRASNNATVASMINFVPSQTKKYTFYARGLMRLTAPNASSPFPGIYTNF